MPETVLDQTRPYRTTLLAPEAKRSRLDYAPMLGAIVLAVLLDTWALGQNGYANVYYSAGVKSMLRSWHNFLFVSADPAGLISIDKPPLGVWVQAVSAKLFGFVPLSLLLPEALAGVATVAALYVIMRKRCGALAATASALTLAAFPAFVAVSRDNNLDALLILLMTLACGAVLRAIETGRLRTLLGSAVLVALAFNTKALGAYLVVPGIAAGYLCCAPGPVLRRVGQLLLAGVVCGVLSVAWMVAVDTTPAAQRPFVGSSTDNSELGLAFGYNGFGRVGGQKGGPGPDANREVLPAVDATAVLSRATTSAVSLPRPSPDVAPKVAATIHESPAAFGTSPGPLRLFRTGFGDQDAWMLTFALIGLVAVALTRPGRRDPRLAVLIVFGGFFLCEAAFLSGSRGIVHPYYVSALGPGTAVMVGAGLAAMAPVGRRHSRLLILAAVLATAAVQVALLHRAHYLGIWQAILLPMAAACALVAVTVSRFSRLSLAPAFAILLVAPTAYAATTWRQPVQGTFPATGPHTVGGNGGAELGCAQLATDEALMHYVLLHGAGGRFQLLTEASLTADGPILLGLRASALAATGGWTQCSTARPSPDSSNRGRRATCCSAAHTRTSAAMPPAKPPRASARRYRSQPGAARGRAGATAYTYSTAPGVSASLPSSHASGLAWVTARSLGAAGP